MTSLRLCLYAESGQCQTLSTCRKWQMSDFGHMPRVVNVRLSKCRKWLKSAKHCREWRIDNVRSKTVALLGNFRSRSVQTLGLAIVKGCKKPRIRLSVQSTCTGLHVRVYLTDVSDYPRYVVSVHSRRLLHVSRGKIVD